MTVADTARLREWPEALTSPRRQMESDLVHASGAHLRTTWLARSIFIMDSMGMVMVVVSADVGGGGSGRFFWQVGRLFSLSGYGLVARNPNPP